MADSQKTAELIEALRQGALFSDSTGAWDCWRPGSIPAAAGTEAIGAAGS
jgi:hypothetical protein